VGIAYGSFGVAAQARISPRMAEWMDHGLFPPYREKTQAGLAVLDCAGEELFRVRYPERIYSSFDQLPRLLVDKRYHAVVQASARSDQDRTFVAECSAQAAWLVKSLDQRAKTILKVASEIVRQQDAFLAFGVECLRPLNLKTVADAISMHESTVSRVTSNKYLATPRGVFELKFFFTSAINSTDGAGSHSAEAVRHKIKQMIEAETAESAVLSDDRIVEILKEAGVDIARRTVAKYREALRIPSSVERRRLLRAS